MEKLSQTPKSPFENACKLFLSEAAKPPLPSRDSKPILLPKNSPRLAHRSTSEPVLTMSDGDAIPSRTQSSRSLDESPVLQRSPSGNGSPSLLRHSFSHLSLPNGNVESVDLLRYAPTEVAAQMTFVDSFLFGALDLHECLHKRFTVKESSPTFTMFTDRFNDWSQWIASEILRRDANSRPGLIGFFIKVAQVSILGSN